MKQNKSVRNPLLLVVMDGIGEREESAGNAVKQAYTPAMTYLRQECPFMTLKAHGRAVGLPSDADMGNSEVGHNAIGSGQVFDQGAKLIEASLSSQALFSGQTWQDLVTFTRAQSGTLHFIGLLSDGNVHSNISHLIAICQAAKRAGIKRVALHSLFDGRDVPSGSAEGFVHTMVQLATAMTDANFDFVFADGGGRMHVTMDRYEADWAMVQRGYDMYVQGQAEYRYANITEALADLRQRGFRDDQYLPTFVLCDREGEPSAKIKDGDGVVLFNFRGDRAIEISLAFEQETFDKFPRGNRPKIYYAGMMQYDGDLAVPSNYLVSPPVIKHTLSEWLIQHQVRQFACSETQKYGHVTYFWNGNRSGYLDRSLEEYLEIPSSMGPFDFDPWMKAAEITAATIQRMANKAFDFGRINLANGDMVGHTGNFQASVLAVSTVDLMLSKLLHAAKRYGYTVLITADHGNADDMYLDPSEHQPTGSERSVFAPPKAKTAHSLSPVPLYVWGQEIAFASEGKGKAGLANLAATACTLMGLPVDSHFQESLINSGGKR